MNKKNAILSLAALIAILAVLIYFAVPGIIIAWLANSHDLKINYAYARLTPHIGAKNEGGLFVSVDMRNVEIRRKTGGTDAYSDLASLVSAPFEGSFKYSGIKGVVRPKWGRITIDKLDANSDTMKVSVKGTYCYAEKYVDIDLLMRISPGLLENISTELYGILLKPGTDGWSSLSVRLKGAFESPAIEITGGRFRLNIQEVSGK